VAGGMTSVPFGGMRDLACQFSHTARNPKGADGARFRRSARVSASRRCKGTDWLSGHNRVAQGEPACPQGIPVRTAESP
jgi:hypothetical protein